MQKLKKAFSLIELSIVILIIGILVAGVTQSSRLISQFRLSSARSLSESAPMSSMRNLILWLDTSSAASFLDSETENNSLVSAWNDINTTSVTKNNGTTATSDARPTYVENYINYLPCLRFNGTDDFISYDGSLLAGSDYSIFAIEKRRSDKIDNFFFGTSGSPTINETLNIGYSSDTSLRFSQSDTDLDAETNAFSDNTSIMHSFIFSQSEGRSYYKNSGTRHHSSEAETALTSNNNAAIGRSDTNYYDGDLGEIIIFNRALSVADKEEVEAYLSKKWDIPLETQGSDVTYIVITPPEEF